jgi:hypothetical protein
MVSGRALTPLQTPRILGCPLLSDISVLELSQLSKLRRIGLVRVSPDACRRARHGC